MHTPDLSRVSSNGCKDEKDDSPSVLGRFLWTVVGSSCIPCLLKSDGTKYVSVRIAESKVLMHFLTRLNAEVFNCVSVKSFGITEAEMKLLNDINTKHCDCSFGKEQFSMDTDFIVKYDDLVEFYQFMDTCYNKLINQAPISNKNKCGFVRINDDSVVPYAVKNDQKYVPLFYFEGETESLKTKAINLENWDLAYLKFCCKVQGIKNELFASEQCLVTSLDDVKSYFPEGTKFDDYWPSKVVEMQTPNRNDLNGNHSWVQTPHIDSSAVVPQSTVPNVTHNLANKTQSALVKQLQNNQRPNPSVINNVSAPTYAPPNAWPASIVGNSLNSTQGAPYQIAQTVQQQQRIAPKQPPVTLQSMNANNMVPRTYSSPAVRSQQYFNTIANNVPNVPVSQTQPPPPLVKVHSTSMSNVYSNAIPASIYSSTMYSTAPVYTLPNAPTQSHHLNTTSVAPLTSRARSTNQVAPNTRYPPGLTPITTVIQSNASNNNTLVAGNRSRVNYSATAGEEIIDLSSPPHSPQQMNVTSMNNITLTNPPKFNNYLKQNTSQEKVVQLPECNSAPHTIPYKVRTISLNDKQVPAVNLEPNNPNIMAITLYTMHTNYFSRMDTKELKEALSVLKCELSKANRVLLQVLREANKHITNDDDLLLIKVDDFNAYYKHLINCGVSPSPNSSVYSYDLGYNNNSNDWLNAGCNKYARQESLPPSPSTSVWSSNPLYLPQTFIDASWAYTNHNF